MAAACGKDAESVGHLWQGNKNTHVCFHVLPLPTFTAFGDADGSLGSLLVSLLSSLCASLRASFRVSGWGGGVRVDAHSRRTPYGSAGCTVATFVLTRSHGSTISMISASEFAQCLCSSRARAASVRYGLGTDTQRARIMHHFGALSQCVGWYLVSNLVRPPCAIWQ